MAAKKPAKKKSNAAGRPTKYSAAHVLAVEMMATLGMTDAQMADRFKVAPSTFYKWRLDHPEFAQAIEWGKEQSDDRVVCALLQRALGYEHADTYFSSYRGEIISQEYIKHYPPDVMAIMYWLNNRKPNEWKHKQHIQHGSDDNIKKLAEEIAKI